LTNKNPLVKTVQSLINLINSALTVFRELWRFHQWRVDWNRRILGGEEICFDTSWACLLSQSVYSSFSSLWFWVFRYRYV